MNGTQTSESGTPTTLLKNLKIDEIKSYVWDYRNRLTNVDTKTSGGVLTRSVAFKYDIFDRRIAKTVDLDGAGAGVTERYVCDRDHIMLVFVGATLKERCLYGANLDQVLAVEGSQVSWTLSDYLGTVRDLVSSAGVVQNHIKYDSFGNVTAQSNLAVRSRFGFTGREFDSETGLYYYRSRYYDSVVGRFISEDRIGFAGGDTNLSRYVRNNVLNFTDPTGNNGFNIMFGEAIRQREQLIRETPITSIHQEVINSSKQFSRPANVNEWNIVDIGRWILLNDPGYVVRFKNQWVCGYRDTINTVANQLNIPSKLLAAVAWGEVGGDPDFADDVGYALRTIFPLSDPPNQTSFGNVQVQVETAALVLGYNPKIISREQSLRIISSLQDPIQNIIIAGKYLSYLQNTYLPGRNPSQISVRDQQALVGAYNGGNIFASLNDFWKPNKKGGNLAQYGVSSFRGLDRSGCSDKFK
jgi:RHS repeat-associated protein